MTDFVRGDKVRHKQINATGEFIRYGKAEDLSRTWPGRGLQRPVFWRPTHIGGVVIPFRRVVDWTWEDVMEPAT